MEKKQMYAVVAAIVIIVAVVAVAVWYVGNDNGGSDESGETGDTYYVYLDGMDDANGWHTGTGETPYEGITDAFENDSIGYEIGENGWVSSIAGFAYDGTNGFGIFVYTSTDLSNPYVGYFCAGPVLADVTGNIIYISYGPYDKDYNNVLNPGSTTDSALTSTGPFADEEYKPLEYDDTYYVYLDGMGEADGWYTGTGSNGMEGILNALEGKVECEIGNDGWISSIAGLAYDGTNGFGIFTYTSTVLTNPYVGYFGAGPTTNTVTGNILYISYGPYDANYNNILNPESTTSGFMSEGPFATA